MVLEHYILLDIIDNDEQIPKVKVLPKVKESGDGNIDNNNHITKRAKIQSFADILKSKVVINDNDMKKICLDLCEESRRLFRLYAGIQRIEGLDFNWICKVDTNGVKVHTASVEGSSWTAVKSSSIFRADKYAIRNLLLDASRIAEYDNSIDGYEMIYQLDDISSIGRYWYKAIWPLAARDGVLNKCWTEFDDGSIMISATSPPPNWYPAKECKHYKIVSALL